MKEQLKMCRFCKYYENLPFSDEYICMSENSDYADCPCNPDDVCEEWESEE